MTMIDFVTPTPDTGPIDEVVGDNEGNSSEFENDPYFYPDSSYPLIEEEVPQAHLAAKAVLGLSYSLMIPVCGIGNLLLCYIIYRFRRMRSTTNLLIGNLAFSDFLVAVIVAPFNFYYYMNQDWPFGKAMCVTVAYLKAVSLYVSTNSLLVIAIDR